MENKNIDPNEVNTGANEIDSEDYDKNLLLEHDYDGIRELDNPPPPWLMWLFYLTVIWAAGYVSYFHWFKEGDLQTAEYENEMAEAAEKYKAASMDLNQLALLTGETDLNEGQEIFTKSCVACHGTNGEGGIGSNLIDSEWIYGNQPKNVFETIKNGTSNGMTSFSSLPDENILKVTSYILVKLNTLSTQSEKIKEHTEEDKSSDATE